MQGYLHFGLTALFLVWRSCFAQGESDRGLDELNLARYLVTYYLQFQIIEAPADQTSFDMHEVKFTLLAVSECGLGEGNSRRLLCCSNNLSEKGSLSHIYSSAGIVKHRLQRRSWILSPTCRRDSPLLESCSISLIHLFKNPISLC